MSTTPGSELDGNTRVLESECVWLSAYTVKIAAGTNHSGFAVHTVDSVPPNSTSLPAPQRGMTAVEDYINFGAEGLYHLPKWDLTNAEYRPLFVASRTEVARLEQRHTRAFAGIYFWLTNCCHHNTERELARFGYDVRGARSTTWFALERIKGSPHYNLDT